MDLSLLFLLLGLFSLEGEATTIISQAEWTVRDRRGNVCMEMSLSAQIKVKLGNQYETPDIEAWFKASGLCSKPFRQFTLTNPNSSTSRSPAVPQLQKLQLGFLSRSTVDYTMPHVSAMWSDNKGSVEGDFKQEENLLRNDVPYSLVYRCNEELIIDLEGGFGKVHLWNIVFKPFAEDSNGKEQVCYTDNTRIIVGSILGILGLACVVSLVIYMICKRYRANHPTWAEIQ